MTATASSTQATLGTVSSPLDLAPQGEHSAVTLGNGNGNGSGSGGRKAIAPKVKVTLTSLTPNNSGTLRKLNSVVIPIVYSPKFYKDVLDPQLDDVNKLIYYADIPVGAICCRFDNPASTSADKPPTLVVLTLAILAPYRSLGLGAALVRHALTSSLNPTPPPAPAPAAAPAAANKGKGASASAAASKPRKPVNRALAHVQVGNDGAKRFYERLGFVEDGRVENYYSKMEPCDAILMVCKDIAGALGDGAGANGSA